jgi:hypothetical protein
MKKDTDRIRRWRERQKAEGKTSFTVLLSQEARGILAEEKGKTGQSYAVIVEKALQTLKMQSYRPPAKKHFSMREGVPARVVTGDHNQRLGIPVTSNEKRDQRKLLLVDNLANCPGEDIKHEQAEKEQNGIYDLKFNEGLVSRLFRASARLFGHKKKSFRLELRGGKAFRVRDD